MKAYPPVPNQAAHLEAPAVPVAAPGPHDLRWTGTRLQEQSYGSGPTGVLLRQPHPHYSRQKKRVGVMKQGVLHINLKHNTQFTTNTTIFYLFYLGF